VLSSLDAAAIALLAEAEVEVVAIQTDPIALSGLCICLSLLASHLVALFEWGEILAHRSFFFLDFKLYLSH
jgi:hypothetical protein